MQFPIHPKLAILATLTYLAIAHPALAENITAAQDGTGTQVVTQGDRIDITGGTNSTSGSNLFHSFQNFNLNPGQTANFIANPATQNILGRVIGGQPSLIDGQISVTGGSPNLFLLNPAGIVFGANANLNVPASFTATTANSVQFGSNVWNLATTPTQLQNLSAAPTGFGLSNGAISNAGVLSVNPGQSLTLVGGTVINTGTFKTEGGNITIAAVGNKFVRISQSGSILGVELPIAPTNSGDAIVSGTVSVATSGPNSGKIDIFGDRIGITNATIDASGAETAGTIRIGGDYQGQGAVPKSQFTTVDRASTLLSEGKTGGQIIIWSDGATRAQGKLGAKGIIQGGSIETSGKQYLDVRH